MGEVRMTKPEGLGIRKRGEFFEAGTKARRYLRAEVGHIGDRGRSGICTI